MPQHDARRKTFCRTIGGNVTRIIVTVDPPAQGIAPNHGNHHGIVPVPAIRIELYGDGVCIQVIKIYGDPKMMHFPFRPYRQFAKMEALPMTGNIFLPSTNVFGDSAILAGSKQLAGGHIEGGHIVLQHAIAAELRSEPTHAFAYFGYPAAGAAVGVALMIK